MATSENIRTLHIAPTARLGYPCYTGQSKNVALVYGIPGWIQCCPKSRVLG